MNHYLEVPETAKRHCNCVFKIVSLHSILKGRMLVAYVQVWHLFKITCNCFEKL